MKHPPDEEDKTRSINFSRHTNTEEEGLGPLLNNALQLAAHHSTHFDRAFAMVLVFATVSNMLLPTVRRLQRTSPVTTQKCPESETNNGQTVVRTNLHGTYSVQESNHLTTRITGHFTLLQDTPEGIVSCRSQHGQRLKETIPSSRVGPTASTSLALPDTERRPRHVEPA